MHLLGLVILLCILYGSVFVFAKLSLEYASPLFITAARMIIAGILLLGFQFCFHRAHFHFKRQYIRPIFIIAFTNVYLTNALEFWGLQYMEAGKACFLYSFAPIATAILSYMWFEEHITVKKWAGLFVGVLGFIPILVAHSGTERASGGFVLFLSYAELALLGAALASAIGWIAMRHTVKNLAYSSLMANGSSMLLGGLFALVHSLLVENWDPTPITDFWPFMQWFVILTIVSNLISYNLNAYLLKIYTATYISFAGLSQPFFAALIAWVLLGEIESLYFWLSFIVVSAGLYIYYKEELRHRHIVRIFPAKK
jgi:drug/metabolite transporter (DMT)-like permease